MKDKECNCCEDAKFGVAYIDPESGLLCRDERGRRGLCLPFQSDMHLYHYALHDSGVTRVCLCAG